MRLMDSIRCPHCGKQVELSEAIVHQLSKAQVDKARAEEREKTEREQKEKALKESEEKDREIREIKNKLAKKDEEEKIREKQIREEAEKNVDAKLRAKDITIEQIRKANEKIKKEYEDIKKKSEQGSQQLQGEVGELWLEDELRKVFSYDELKPVPKGVNGGDIVHIVKNKFGNVAGTILWEAKKQKAWSKGWLTKLKEDMRRVNASDCVIVTDILPSGVKNYDRIENVWVSSYDFAINLATALRYGVLNVAIARSGASHTDENLKKFYDIVNSDKFRHALQARKEIITNMEEELEADRTSAERRWKRQSNNIEKLKSNNRELVLMLEDHVPALKALDDERPLLTNGDDEDTTLF